MSKRLEQTGKYIAGKRMTIADILTIAFAMSHIYNPKDEKGKMHQEMIEQYPRVEKYFKKMRTEFKDYLNRRPECNY